MTGSGPLLLGAVFLLALVIQQTGAANPDVFDLPKKIQEFVDHKSRIFNVPVNWWNMYGNHSHLIEWAAKYRQYKVSSTVGSFQYGSVSKSSFEPRVVHTQWSHNNMPTEPIIVSVKRTKTRTHQYSWQTQNTMSVGHSLSIEGGLPKVVSITGSFSKTVSLSKTTGQVKTVSEEYTAEAKVTIPPMKSAKIEWVITDVTQEIPWTAQIDVEGWFAVWFRERVHDHHLWFYNVKELKDPLLEQTQKGVRYTARGIFTGVHGIDSRLNVSQYDIGDYGGRPTDVYTIPLPSPHLRSR
uniref:Putative cytotoxin n=1 Tax=Ixodes scapularis TaxID=6945 RepID=A0A4D5RLJ5_IXOSC